MPARPPLAGLPFAVPAAAPRGSIPGRLSSGQPPVVRQQQSGGRRCQRGASRHYGTRGWPHVDGRVVVEQLSRPQAVCGGHEIAPHQHPAGECTIGLAMDGEDRVHAGMRDRGDDQRLGGELIEPGRRDASNAAGDDDPVVHFTALNYTRL